MARNGESCLPPREVYATPATVLHLFSLNSCNFARGSCTMPTITYAPSLARVCVHHSFIPFSRFIFIEGPVCVHFFLAAEYRVAGSYICRLRFDTRFFVPSAFFLFFFFFLFLPRTKKNIPEFTLCLNLFDQRFPILSTRCSHLLESESLKKII